MSPISITCLMAALSGPITSKQIWAFAQSDLMMLGYLKRDAEYKALPRLIKEKLITSVSDDIVRYQITPLGKMKLRTEARRMQDLSVMLRRFLQENP